MRREESIVSDFSCWATMAVFVLGLVTLAVRLKEVQIDGAADYNYEKARQSERLVQTAGARGRILDRKGNVLADNRRCLSIVCNAAFFRKNTWEATAAAISSAVMRVSAAVGVPSRLTMKTIRRHVHRSLAMPLVSWYDVSEEQLARFAERVPVDAGFYVKDTLERTYPNGSLASHLLGYVGRDRGSGEAGDRKFNFRDLELRGRSGLELYYDSYLRGVPGESKLLVDARGFPERMWTVAEARPGPDLRLTIDIALQRAVEAQLSNVRGACVVLDPRDGSILAFASAPGYNPNDFVPVLTQETYERHLHDPSKPLLNRASGGLYAPGSTFKPVTALAGLRMGYPDGQEYFCSGVFAYGRQRLRCANRWGHGPIAMRSALKASCNTFFCHLGCEAGTNALCAAARAFGLGAPTGIDFTDDRAGVVPDAGWKGATYGQPWFLGDLVQMSIGQGMLLVSPLQMALLAGAIGTGYRVTPRFRAGGVPARSVLPFPRRHLAIVREGVRRVVDGGTGRRGGAGVAVTVCGKTGTAEVGPREKRRKNTWFIAYAPARMPTVAAAIVVEDGESGGATAAPRMAEILKEIFND
jgi:penicillin-binding protein 2